MRRTTVKVAELATILYAILVVMSLIIDSAYYSQFNIRIVSYMSVSEILLSCIEWFDKYAIPLCVVGVVFLFYLIYLEDPMYCFTKNPLDWVKKLGNPTDELKRARLQFFFGKRTSTHAKYSVLRRYEIWIVLLPPLVIGTSLCPYQEILFIYESSKLALIALLIIYLLFSVFFVGSFAKDKIKYDWTAHPTREKMYEIDRLRKQVAPGKFSDSERKMIEHAYRYRSLFICLVFFVSLFVALNLAMFYSGKHIKERGNDKCVVLKCNGKEIDTRNYNLDYIGESAGFIFIYDRETQGTMVYERKTLDFYLVINTSAVTNDNLPYLRDTISYTTHVKESISEDEFKRNEILISDFVIDYECEHLQLLAHPLNHYIWHDSISNTFLEQITISKALFDHLPADNEIFRLEKYVKDKDRTNIHGNGTVCTYHARGGENIKTLVCQGTNYTAWLYYDSSGKNLRLGDRIFDSIKAKQTYKHMGKEDITLLILILLFIMLIVIEGGKKVVIYIKDKKKHHA